MNSTQEKSFVVRCDKDFTVQEVLVTKNIAIKIASGEHLSKIILADDLSRFFEFTLQLKNQNAVFGLELCFVEQGGQPQLMDLGGVEYDGSYIITAFSNFLGLYEHLTQMNNIQINKLREEMKALSALPSSYLKFTLLNNEILNMQRELARKNAEIVSLLKHKDDLNSRLQAANATKDRIFSIIGHDLRGPLAAIIEGINLVALDKSMYEELQNSHFFEHLKDDVGSAMLLLENLLEWSRSHIGELPFHPVHFELSYSVREALFLLRGTAGNKRIILEEQFSSEPIVFADQRMIGTIIRNLVSNAIKFSHPDSKVKVSIKSEPGFARVSVKDYGVGIPELKLTQLFCSELNSIDRGTRGEKGVGFGLILCKNLIERNEGTIAVSSHEGEGSEFSITIPLAK